MLVWYKQARATYFNSLDEICMLTWRCLVTEISTGQYLASFRYFCLFLFCFVCGGVFVGCRGVCGVCVCFHVEEKCMWMDVQNFDQWMLLSTVVEMSDAHPLTVLWILILFNTIWDRRKVSFFLSHFMLKRHFSSIKHPIDRLSSTHYVFIVKRWEIFRHNQNHVFVVLSHTNCIRICSYCIGESTENRHFESRPAPSPEPPCRSFGSFLVLCHSK